MNMFRKEKGSAATPTLPPRPSKQAGTDESDLGRVPGGSGANLDSQEQAMPMTGGAQQGSNQKPASLPKSKRTRVMDVMQKVNPFKASSQAPPLSQTPSTVTADSTEMGTDSTQNPGMLKGMIQKVNPFKSSTQAADKDSQEESTETPQTDGLDGKQNPGMLASVIQKVNPFKSWQSKPDAASSQGSPTDLSNLHDKTTETAHEETDSVQQDVASLPDSERSGAPSVGHEEHPSNAEPSRRATEQPKKRKKTFRIKRILPASFFGSGAKDSDARTQEVEVQTLEMADLPSLDEAGADDPLEDEGGLLAWWRTVDGWAEWNETTQDHQSEEVVEEAADRVYMAARLFVRLFNRRGASLQQRVLALLALADAADNFHKKTVSASVGGGVAGVAGSVTTITGLILAPFTAGTSLIVTAVGIGVATAGGITSASANITDTVHSKTDRKKVEKMIQDYQEEMNDIKECLQFLEEGMETLEEWNFEQYAQSISQKHLNQNVKHVMKEGGRAGKALVINTESLINTVQILSVAGGAAKAAQVISVTTGVMSGLFLALDIFFLAKDSMELRKGAKTEFAAKIREVCKDLQDGLLELNRIKEELQKTMDGIQVEEEEEEDDIKSELKKLIELEE
ncbi:uncharacterized protein apold1b isoform X1 [Syngnathus typhle]|uniref:uncharacterized protein apold1b isoform X1 n=1 Tax=Syngnathus typhle TaxID=161592 RepID=UPI002A6B0E77|nr:uncharacterized protein apold1b isoform X1 [Syngnathus typhle]XP_061130854.1 uncharacterized protein apold1b isoform X1 [Syngnathus typhle]XP_061130863.1 uncharacterized protein apold1b isoform X1 [Syngnathus typhle]